MENNERKKHLLETMKLLNKSLGSEIVGFGEEHEDEEMIPSGIKEIDDFIGGGFKAGAFSVIYGAEATGKSSLVLQSIAYAQSIGKVACYIDLEHSFSKDRALQFGINLQELVLVEKCQTAEDALNIIRGLCKEKVIDIFVVDSVQAMSPLNQQENKGKMRDLEEKEIAELARLMSKFFQVVSPDVFRAKAAVIMIGQVRIGGIGTFFTRATMTGGEAIKHAASLRLFMRRGQGADAPKIKVLKEVETPDGIVKRKVDEAIGFDTVIKIEKTRFSNSAKENSEIHVPFYYETGFINPSQKSNEKVVNFDNHIISEGEPLSKTNSHATNKEELINAVETSTAIEDVKVKLTETKKSRGRPKKGS